MIWVSWVSCTPGDLLCRGSNGDRSKAGPAPRPTKEGYSTDALQEAGSLLLRKCHDIYPCSRLALQVGNSIGWICYWTLGMCTMSWLCIGTSAHPIWYDRSAYQSLL